MAENKDLIAIYSRKSRFTGKGESVGNQVELCRAYIRTAFGEKEADEAAVFEDEGFSGGDLNRPGFQRLMEAARKRRLRAVVVYRLDRISRNISDFSALIQELGRMGVDFISIRESFDTSSPMGRAMMYIASVFSQLERETIAERIRDNLHELAKTGRWLGGTTPTGYTSEAVRRDTADGKSKKVCRLRLLPEEADVVRGIYELYGRTHSLAMTEAELLRQRIQTKNGRNFTRFSIKGILQNPVYLMADRDAYGYFAGKGAELCSPPEAFDGTRGILAYHRTDQEKGRSTVYLPVSAWIVAVGEHPGIIPAREWIAVQEALERGRSKGYRGPRSGEALLTGLLWCRCGSRMYPKGSKRRTAEGKPVYTYVCKMKERSKGAVCGAKNANGNLLDAAVAEALSGLAGDREALLARLEQGKEACAVSREAYEKELEGLRRRQGETERKIRALVDTLAGFGGSAAAGHVKERIEGLHLEAEALGARIRAREEARDRGALGGEALARLGGALSVFRVGMDGMTLEQRRAAVGLLVRKVVWDGGTAHVFLAGTETEGDAQAPLGEDSE